MTGTNRRRIRLHSSSISREAISAAAAETLRAGGWVAPPPEPQVGAKMPDGTVFAGISPDTNRPMYVTPADAPLTYTFNQATEYAAKLDVHGHQDWRVPTKNELNVLFNNRAAIGGFNVSGSNPAGWYWSATPNHRWLAWCQRFSDGAQDYYYKDIHSSVRLVR